MSMPSKQKMIFGFLVMIALTLQGCTLKPTVENDAALTGETQTKVETVNTGAKAAITAVLNGVFNLSGTYNSPAGLELMNATVTIENDIITAVSAQNVAKAPKSKVLQDQFISGIAGQVVGKNIKDVNVSYVNGSSLTAKSFNDALHALEK